MEAESPPHEEAAFRSEHSTPTILAPVTSLGGAGEHHAPYPRGAAVVQVCRRSGRRVRDAYPSQCVRKTLGPRAELAISHGPLLFACRPTQPASLAHDHATEFTVCERSPRKYLISEWTRTVRRDDIFYLIEPQDLSCFLFRLQGLAHNKYQRFLEEQIAMTAYLLCRVVVNGN